MQGVSCPVGAFRAPCPVGSVHVLTSRAGERPIREWTGAGTALEGPGGLLPAPRAVAARCQALIYPECMIQASAGTERPECVKQTQASTSSPGPQPPGHPALPHQPPHWPATLMARTSFNPPRSMVAHQHRSMAHALSARRRLVERSRPQSAGLPDPAQCRSSWRRRGANRVAPGDLSLPWRRCIALQQCSPRCGGSAVLELRAQRIRFIVLYMRYQGLGGNCAVAYLWREPIRR